MAIITLQVFVAVDNRGIIFCCY